jgi:formylglycine-generating enzyme required for sulfatase activity
MLKALREEISAALPQFDEQKKAAYLEACNIGKAANADSAKAQEDATKAADALNLTPSRTDDKLDMETEEATKADSANAQEDATKAADAPNLTPFLTDDRLDSRLVKFVVLHDATPGGLAEFAQQGAEQAALVDTLLADPELMKQMLVADGTKENKYGRATEIYTAIQKTSAKAKDGVLQRLALAVALEHAAPVKQDNPAGKSDAPATVDPVKRYLHYEKAYLAGELDPAFKDLTAWDLRFVVNGDEPDDTLAWGREMLKNYRPDLVANPDYNWRYVQAVATDVKYGSGDVKFDRPELQSYQNILMNGGVCGRRAFFGRFILRAFGIPTTARPQSGHGALVHWTPKGWVPCLGGGWGCGWTNTRYRNDLDFLATTQARGHTDAYLQVKRAQWIGDVVGETPVHGLHGGVPGFWYAASLCTQRDIIEKAKAKALAAVGTNLGESNETGEKAATETVAVADSERQITVGKDGVITIPAAAYNNPTGSIAEVTAMKSFAGGQQICLPRFSTEGLTIIRGGTWKLDPASCTSGGRGLSGGYGAYEDWGLRVAVTPAGANPPANLTLDLGGGVTLELVYIKPGTFVMGGESTTDGRFNCVEVPKHEVTLTKGFYLGKYEVTQAQHQSIMGSNPSKSTKDPNCPVDNIPESDATDFCGKLAAKTGQPVRLPTEAEWEYACRAGSTTKWFIGDDPAPLGEYGWFKDNAGGKSHPVGQKKPNPWGLYDMYGNVCERMADRYAKDYYAKSPKENPTGPAQKRHSCFDYTINVPRSGKYSLTARVVANNYNQKLTVSVNGEESEVTMALPFTCGQWKDCDPVTLTLKEGENALHLSRTDPPQAGIAIKSFTLTPAE